ncbi:hypothetical protein [Antrihabitans stalactiti]|uniref:hypothetical protein n=1 Tax=Antrihabitans stalactiti TaxID=2584121 RepID=UPI00197D1D15|nr:hypothetical protein [Antrihabitans stalactiti]
MNRVVRASIAALVAGTAIHVAFTPSANAEPVSSATDRQERVLAERDGIVVSVVSYRLPLAADAPPHPSDCDRTGFLRYRPADGPANSRDAEHVVVQEQGLGGGATNSDSVATNTVRSAMRLGHNIEFWALARRSQCLDETTGFDFALRSGNYLDAVDYYFNGKEIDGRKFPGFRQSSNLQVLDWMGLDRVVRDQYELMLAEIPDQAVRQRKFVCTGISLGGLVTGLFADWDFDGNPATQDDAGFNQCAAFAAQDSMVSSDPAAIQNTPFFRDVTNVITGGANDVLKAGFRADVMPRIFGPVPVTGTKAFLILRLAGLAAHLAPDAESQLLQHLPRDLDIDLTLNTLFAPTWAAFATNGADGSGTIRDFRFTNTALLGTLIDNNSTNFSLLQQGVGALAGGPVQDKSFPNPGEATQIPVLGGYLRISAGPQRRVAPTDHHALYTWRNYDDVAGVPYTAPNHEVADIRDVARQLAAGSPYAYWETYFPLRVVVDIGAAYGGARSGDMSNLRYAGMSRTKPNLAVFGGDSSVQNTAGALFPPPMLAQVQTMPGYNHIDTIGAAAVQNNGALDYSGQYLAEFVAGL